MCGRFTQHLSWAELHALADLIGQPRNLAPRYNIAPTTQIEVIRPATGGNELIPMRWGLVPAWWKKPLKELPSTFNARAETVAEKPMFRSAFKSRRCVIPASGYYEWTGKTGSKVPHYITVRDGRPLAFAGLWESWKDPESGEPIDTATIVVGAANAWGRPIHDRMPIILAWRDASAWMAGDVERAVDLLRAPPDDALQEWVVSPRVNKAGVGDDDPAMLNPV